MSLIGGRKCNLHFYQDFSGLCCLTLVVWTVIITASPLVDPNAENGLNNTNVTVSAVCPLNASLAIDEVVFFIYV